MDIAALESTIEQELKRFGVPGCAVTIVKDDEVVLSRGFGHRDVDNELPVTAQTLFPIGSSTKAFTASVIATLVDDGHFDWDTPVVELLPGFKMYDPIATLQLTPRDMLCHRSGLPRHDLLWYNNTSLTRADVVGRLRYLEPSKTFRERWQYNNLMYLTSGFLAEHFLGVTWEQAVRDRLLEPLGMSNTNFSVAESAKSDDHSLPYNEKDGVTKAIALRGLDLAGPAGSINSCIADMARWVRLNTGGGEVDGKRVLSAAALRELHAPTMVLGGSELSVVADLYPETYMTAYALGWVRETYRGHKLVHHGGNIDGFSSMVSMLPSERLGVVVLTNLNASFARDIIPYLVYDRALALEPLPWGERMHSLHASLQGGGKAAQAHAASKAQSTPPSHPLDDYVGTYAHPGYGTLTITRDGEELVPNYNNLEELEMSHRHYDVWDIKLDLFELVIPASFATDPAGEIASVAVPFEGSVSPIVFLRQPDSALSETATLSQYVGTYVMDPLRINVSLGSDGALVAELMGQHLRLQPHRAGVFKVADGANVTVEFDGDKVVVAGVGVFEKVAE